MREGKEGSCGGSQHGTGEGEARVAGQRGRQCAARWVERAYGGMLNATVNGCMFQHLTMGSGQLNGSHPI